MGKAKRERKKARKANRELEEQAKAEEARRVKKHRAILAAIPTATVVVALTLYFALEEPQLAGATVLGGTMVWLMVGLGFIGGSVKPRDRNRAGSIDFGNRQR
ncbi:MAG: hypothetical protein AAGF12_11530 [Myxococcota bacterium]